MDEEQIKNLPENEQIMLENFRNEQIEFFDQIDPNKRMQLLLVVRGHEINQLQAKLAVVSEEMMRENRAMNHKLSMTEKELEETRSKLDQAFERERFHVAELEKSVRLQSENASLIEKLKKVLLLFIFFLVFRQKSISLG